MPTPEFLLHHYWLSPFSEKVRLLLGHAGLSWGSVEQSPRLPRPELMQLTGGYRRIPVLQIGADIHCDTHVIGEVIAARAPAIDLLPEDRRTLVQEQANWADSRLFQVVLAASLGGGALRALRQDFGFRRRDVAALVWDRLMMMRGARLERIRPRDARAELHDFLAGFDLLLGQSQAYRFGNRPTLADFSIYHVLRLGHDWLKGGFASGYPEVLAWMERMKAIGHGQYQPVSIKDAQRVAAECEPAPLPADSVAFPDGLSAGEAVRIAPADYGVTPTDGLLMAVTDTRWVIARDVKGLGRLHLHFPREDYRLQRR